MTSFEWDLEKIIWFLGFVLSVFTSMTNWAAKYARPNVKEDLESLATRIEDTRQYLLHCKNDEGTAMSKEEVREELTELEDKYQLKSEEFYNEWYKKGKADERGIEGTDALRWATFWEWWLKLGEG